MKRLFLAFILIVLVFVTLTPAFADYPMYSGDPTRTRYIQDASMDTPIHYQWNFNTGWSVSQPITVTDNTGKTFIYQIGAVPDSNNSFQLPAGSYLYKLPVLTVDTSKLTHAEQLKLAVDNGAKAVRLGSYTKTYSHITWSKENGYFYLGWGTGASSKLIAIGEDLNPQKIYMANIGETIISSPYVLSNDLAIFGAMDGVLYAVKGLASNKPVASKYIFDSATNAEITSHITSIPNTNLFATGLNYRKSSKNGRFQLFKITDNGKDLFGNPKPPTIAAAWKYYYSTSTGASTDAIYYQSKFVFSDKGGTLYTLNAIDGKQIAKVRFPHVPVSIVNNSPALDISTNRVFFPIRQPGGVLAVRFPDLAFVWYAKQGMDKVGNKVDENVATGRLVENNTTVWRTKKGKPFVFYGDDAGQLIFLDTNGNRAEIAKSPDGKVESSITVARDASVPTDRKDWTVQGKGLATELVVDSNYLIFGTNNGDRGTTWAYSIAGADDLALEFVSNRPSEPPTPGAEETYVELKLRHNMAITTPFKTKLKYTFDMVTYQEQEITVYPKESYPDGQPIQIVTPFAVPSKPYPFWAEVNQDDKAPHEENHKNNVVNMLITPQALDLSLVPDSWRMSIATPQRNVAFGVYVTAHMEHISGVKAPIKTTVALKMDGESVDEIEIQIAPGQTLEVGPFWVKSSRSSSTMSAEINPYRTRPGWEPDWENNKIKERVVFRDGLDLYVSSLYPEQKIVKGQIMRVETIVGNGRLSTEDVQNALVRFYFDGKLIDEERIALARNERRTLYFEHRVPNVAGNHMVRVTINEDFLYSEMTYTNNVLTAGIVVQEPDLVTPPPCSGDKPSGLVHVECDDDGNCTYYYEYLDMEIIGWDRKPVKAGQPLNFAVKTEYYTEWGAYKDVQRVYAVFSAPAGQAPKVIDLIPDKRPGSSVSSSTNTWRFPNVWLEEWSGKEFYDPNDPEIDPREKLLDGGKKYYTPMEAPAGPFPFKIVAERAGKNNLERCIWDSADIVGDFDTFTHDEYYVRPVVPFSMQLAFPQSTDGTYWAGKEDEILQYAGWFEDKIHEPTPEDYNNWAAIIENGKYAGGWIVHDNDMDLYTDLLDQYEKKEE
jgi:hypothetical protein